MEQEPGSGVGVGPAGTHALARGLEEAAGAEELAAHGVAVVQEQQQDEDGHDEHRRGHRCRRWDKEGVGVSRAGQGLPAAAPLPPPAFLGTKSAWKQTADTSFACHLTPGCQKPHLSPHTSHCGVRGTAQGSGGSAPALHPQLWGEAPARLQQLQVPSWGCTAPGQAPSPVSSPITPLPTPFPAPFSLPFPYSQPHYPAPSPFLCPKLHPQSVPRPLPHSLSHSPVPSPVPPFPAPLPYSQPIPLSQAQSPVPLPHSHSGSPIPSPITPLPAPSQPHYPPPLLPAAHWRR